MYRTIFAKLADVKGASQIEYSHFGSDGTELDTADTGTITIVGDLDVSLVTPGCTPRVLDKVVGLSVLSSVSDSEDTVIKGGSALRGVEDATGVALEGNLVGLDGNRCWGSLDGSHQSRAGALSDHLVTKISGHTRVVASVASSGSGSVCVV